MYLVPGQDDFRSGDLYKVAVRSNKIRAHCEMT